MASLRVQGTSCRVGTWRRTTSTFPFCMLLLTWHLIQFQHSPTGLEMILLCLFLEQNFAYTYFDAILYVDFTVELSKSYLTSLFSKPWRHVHNNTRSFVVATLDEWPTHISYVSQRVSFPALMAQNNLHKLLRLSANSGITDNKTITVMFSLMSAALPFISNSLFIKTN